MPDKKMKIRGDDPKLQQAKKRGDSRSIHFPNGIWQWNTDGYRSATLTDPKGKRFHIDFLEEKNGFPPLYDWLEEGETVDDFLNGDPDREYRIPVTPQDIKSYIETNF